MSEPPTAESPIDAGLASPPDDDAPAQDEPEQARRLVERLRRLQSITGLTLLPAYLVYHLWEQWPALQGIDAWRDRVELGPTGAFAAMLIALPFVLHGCVGLGLSLGSARTGGDPVQLALRPARMVTGSLVLGFLVYHLWHVGMFVPAPHHTVSAAFGRLWTDLGRPVTLVIYVVGVSAACLHMALGLSRVIGDALKHRGTSSQMALLAVGVVVAPIWLMFMELIAYFATGDGLWPG